MKTFLAFLKKEGIERLRGGHILILGVLFVLFGIMNPAIAKLTPWMMELLSDTLAESGMVVSGVSVDALTSWTQFYKNIPIVLIVFVLITCGVLTGECQKGTLIPVLTKGLSRTKVICAKFVSLALMWSAGYWLCYAVTYAYNAYFWDNSIAPGLAPPALAYYLFGLWVLSLVMLFSSFSSVSTGVLLGTGGVCLAAYLLSLIPKLQPYTPMRLTEAMPAVTGALKVGDLLASAIITILMIFITVVLSCIIFKKRKL